MSYDFKLSLEEIFTTSKFGVLGTSMNDEVWTNPQYFTKDGKWNLYFRSLPDTKHMINIKSNSNVSVSFFNSHQTEPYRAIQLSGVAKILTTKEEIEEVLPLYLGDKEDSTVEEYLDDVHYSLVKIEIKELYIFDQEAFLDHRQLVDPKEYR